MVRILLPVAAMLAACTPSSEEAAMRSPGPPGSEDSGTNVPAPARQAAGDPRQAAQGPIPEPIPVTADPVPAGRPDSPAEAEGRRTLSTAFVMVGPDNRLTVELRDGRVLALRDVVMRPRDYCGVQVHGGKAGAKFCGGYADVAAARPGPAPSPEVPAPAVSNLVEPSPSLPKPK